MKESYTKYQIQTPTPYVSRLLDQATYQSNLIGKKILENSFGQGNILYEIVRRYIHDGLKNNVPLETIKVGLTRDIIGYEIDLSCIRICRDRLNKLVQQYGINNVDWDLRNRDFLKDSIEQVDFIVGNPPYITYHDLKEEERIYLKKHFRSCEKGRFDYYYAFIERSLACLKPLGKLVYLVPYGLLTNKFAETIRRMLSNHLKEIVDFRSMNVFGQVMCTPISIVYQNTVPIEVISLTKEKIGITRQFSKKNFIMGSLPTEISKAKTNSNTDSLTLGDIIHVTNSIATLSNGIFIFSPERQDDDFYYINGFKVEKNITLPAISPKSIALQKNMRVIFPYQYEKYKVIPIPEEELKNKYPNTYHYLLSHKEELMNRSLQKNVGWYEFGRRQALEIVSQPKLIMSNVVTKKIHIHLIPANTVPYAGLCIVLKNTLDYQEKLIRQLEIIRSILLKEEFLRFLVDSGTPTIGRSLRVSVRDIQAYSLCEKDKFVILQNYKAREIDIMTMRRNREIFV